MGEKSKIMELFEKTKEEITPYFKGILNDIVLKDEHNSNFKYLYENDKNGFLEYLECIFFDKAMHSIMDCGEIKQPLTAVAFGTCANCSLYAITYKLEENILSAIEPCDYKLKEYSFDINIPSGKMVFCDWPIKGEDIFIHLDDSEDYINVNGAKGRFQLGEKYAKENIMHFFVGGIGPTISQRDNMIYAEIVKYNKKGKEVYTDKNATLKGSICCDVHWITGFDLEHYKELLKNKIGEEFLNSKEFKNFLNDRNVIILDVEPGSYKCTNYYETISFDERTGDKTGLFIKIEKI